MTEVIEKFEIRNRWTNAVQFTAEISVKPDMTYAVKLGLAVKWGVKARADLTGANLTGADLTGANLARAYLTGANLTGANLTGANLTGAYLTGAYLTGAYLPGAHLTGANLPGAYLTGAYLAGANLTGAKLAEVITISKTPIQVQGIGPWPVIIFDRHMKIGCQLHSLAEWEAFDNREIIAMDGRDAAKFWAINKDMLLGLARAHGRSFEPLAKALGEGQ